MRMAESSLAKLSSTALSCMAVERAKRRSSKGRRMCRPPVGMSCKKQCLRPTQSESRPLPRGQLKWVKSSRWDWKGMLTLGSVGSLGFAMMSVQSRMMSMVMSGVRNMKNLRRTEKSKSALKQTRQSQCMKSGTS